MSDSLYGAHSRSPVPPRISGHSPPPERTNQCDGCAAGAPIDAHGLHRMGTSAYPDYMACQRAKYVDG